MSKRLWPAAVVLVLFGLLSAQEVSLAPAKSYIQNIRFENVSHLSAVQKAQLNQDLQDQNPREVTTPRALVDRIEQAVLAAYADGGYWKVRLKVEKLPAHDAFDGEVSFLVRAIEEGRQYRLEDLQWNGVKAYPESNLSQLVPIHSGQILERNQIAEGMEAVRRLYLGGGYLSYVAVPEVKMNERDGTAEVRIDVDEGGLFTVQGFDVIGLTPALRARLLQAWPFKPGDIYRGENVENFLNSNAALLPPMVAADIVCRTVDLSSHTIEFVLDFRPQPACDSQPEAQVIRQSLVLSGNH